MIRRLLRRSEFERVLAVPPCLRSAHFAVHYLQARPAVARRTPTMPGPQELSTESSTLADTAVDNLPDAIWLGQVIPKRHAPRAVTRNLLRRQVRTAVERHQAHLRHGLWLVRLRRPFARADFPSAASAALRQATTHELDRLLARARP